MRVIIAEIRDKNEDLNRILDLLEAELKAWLEESETILEEKVSECYYRAILSTGGPHTELVATPEGVRLRYLNWGDRVEVELNSEEEKRVYDEIENRFGVRVDEC